MRRLQIYYKQRHRGRRIAMNKRQAKKALRKAVYAMQQGRRTKAGTWKKKDTRRWDKEMRNDYETY